MTKQEHIIYWLKSSEKDWEAVEDLYKTGRYVHGLFFAHLVLEKICKAIWVKNNEGDYPPRIHNLVKILAQAKVTLEEEDSIFLADMNKFQLEGRYPDFISDIYSSVNKETAGYYLEKTKTIKQWLTKKLQ